MTISPKNVQKAVQLAVALANPELREQDWTQLKERFQLDDHFMTGIKTLVETCKTTPQLKTVLTYLTHGA